MENDTVVNLGSFMFGDGSELRACCTRLNMAVDHLHFKEAENVF